MSEIPLFVVVEEVVAGAEIGVEVGGNWVGFVILMDEVDIVGTEVGT